MHASNQKVWDREAFRISDFQIMDAQSVQEQFDIRKADAIAHVIHISKEKIYIFPLDAEKALDKKSTTILYKTKKQGQNGFFPSMIKINKFSSKAGIFSGETRGTLTKLKNKIRMLSFTSIINIGLKMPVSIIRKERYQRCKNQK